MEWTNVAAPTADYGEPFNIAEVFKSLGRTSNRATSHHLIKSFLARRIPEDHPSKSTLPFELRRKVIFSLDHDTRLVLSCTCKHAYNLVHEHMAEFFYLTKEPCFIANRHYAFKDKTFSLISPEQTQRGLTIYGNMRDRRGHSQEINAQQFIAALVLAVQANPIRIEFVSLQHLTADIVAFTSSKIAALEFLQVKHCFYIPPYELLNAEILYRINTVVKLESFEDVTVYVPVAGSTPPPLTKTEKLSIVESVRLEQNQPEFVGYDIKEFIEFDDIYDAYRDVPSTGPKRSATFDAEYDLCTLFQPPWSTWDDGRNLAQDEAGQGRQLAVSSSTHCISWSEHERSISSANCKRKSLISLYTL